MTDDDIPQSVSRRGRQMWTVFDHPPDFPDCYVAKASLNSIDVNHFHTFETDEALEDMRAMFRQRGMVCVERHPEDDPKIMEVWL